MLRNNILNLLNFFLFIIKKSNTIKGETCYYPTYSKIKGNPTKKEYSNTLLQDILKMRLLITISGM